MKLEYFNPAQLPKQPRWLRYLITILIFAATYLVVYFVCEGITASANSIPVIFIYLTTLPALLFYPFENGSVIFAVAIDGCLAGLVIAAIWHFMWSTRGYWLIDVD